jgi:hypothetical protein
MDGEIAYEQVLTQLIQKNPEQLEDATSLYPLRIKWGHLGSRLKKQSESVNHNVEWREHLSYLYCKSYS